MSLDNYNTHQLEQELKKRQNAADKDRFLADDFHPMGIWRVTTEGDVEGKSTRDLGVWKGHLADIALALADHSYYGLRFERAEVQIPCSAMVTKRSVNVSLDLGSGTWDMDGQRRVNVFREILSKHASNHEFVVRDGKVHASVILEFC